ISPEPPAPSPSPALAPSSPSPAASARPAASLSPANEFGDKIKQKVDRKLKHKGFDITIDGSDEDEHGTVHGNGDIPRSVVPIVVVMILAIYCFSVAIVAVIMASSLARWRSLCRTVRMRVE